jgi:hypothetical protein
LPACNQNRTSRANAALGGHHEQSRIVCAILLSGIASPAAADALSPYIRADVERDALRIF